MFENYVELSIVGLTHGITLPSAYILVLQGNEGLQRYISILISEKGYKRIQRAHNEHDNEYSNLMIELGKVTIFYPIRVEILLPKDGRTMAQVEIQMKSDYATLELPVDEAILLSIASGCPIEIDRTIFEGLSQGGDPNGPLTLPIIGMSDELLRESLQDSVESENFEMASILRDELRRRGLETEGTNSISPKL